MQQPARAAFAFWEGRIAPVFDVARQVVVVEKTPEAPEQRPVVALPDGAAAAKVGVLLEWRVNALVCGAVSRPLQECIQRQGIQVLPFMMGEVEELVQAWRTDRLAQDAFLMPGCRGRQGGRGRRGQGKGGGYQGGRRRAPNAAEPAELCLCPRCGYQAPHTPGTPCGQLRCPRCRSVMVRTP